MKGSETGAISAGLVRLSALRKYFLEGDRRRTVLDGIDATFAESELVVLMGRSGSGKSTLLNLISGIDLPSSGNVSIGSAVLTTMSERERTLFRRRNVGFVFQSFNLISTLTVLENLLLPMELNGRSAPEEAYGLLERVGLRDRAGSYPDRLSGGERQRVAIARALAHHPLLILADEPTGNLDFDTGAAVMSLLEALVREQGTTMIVATHDRDIIPRADRVVLLRSGRLEDVARGDLEEHASGMPLPPAEGI